MILKLIAGVFGFVVFVVFLGFLIYSVDRPVDYKMSQEWINAKKLEDQMRRRGGL